MVRLKNILGKCKSFPKAMCIVMSARKIKREEEKIIKNKNYVEAIHILRLLGDYGKDEFFLRFLDAYPDSSLFVLGFANFGSDSHERAYSMLIDEYDGDEDLLKKDVEMTFDDRLCDYLGVYHSEEDCRYVQFLTDGATWLESNKRSMRELL